MRCGDEDKNQLLNSWKQVSFKMNSEAFIHGLGGYFDCVLYKEVKFSKIGDFTAADSISNTSAGNKHHTNKCFRCSFRRFY